MIKLKWYVVDKEYVKYLRKFDSRVENIDYKGNLKPYIGIIIKINNFNYYVPISSPKKKHYKMKDSMDLIRIRRDNKILGVLNLNNMIPISNQYIKLLEYDKIDQYRDFENDVQRRLYIKLLDTELDIINSKNENIRKCAIKLYQEKINNPTTKVAMRCCDFQNLEEKAKVYANKDN